MSATKKRKQLTYEEKHKRLLMTEIMLHFEVMNNEQLQDVLEKLSKKEYV